MPRKGSARGPHRTLRKLHGLMAKQHPSTKRAAINAALDGQQRLRITYDSAKSGGPVTREVRPYETKGAKLWATHTLHGADHIHSFTVSQIKSATPIKGSRVRPPAGRFSRPWAPLGRCSRCTAPSRRTCGAIDFAARACEGAKLGARAVDAPSEPPSCSIANVQLA
jgi:hypothetical protein